MSRQKIWTKLLNSYRVILHSLMNFLKHQSGSCVDSMDGHKSLFSTKVYSLCFKDEQKTYGRGTQ